MNSNSDRLIELFGQAIEIESPAERARFVMEACKDEPESRAQLEALLQAHQEAGPFLKSELISVAPNTASEGPGHHIGRYRLLQKIGEGGCGVVYLAEQEEPVSRKVALKVIKLGMDTESVIARFEAERQAVAMMDHPNIATILDAGATKTGRPYFVMELVRGSRITDHCDQNNLSTVERLALFMQVCRAIEHAHQKGVIHRDIKPSNVLVTVNDGVAVPKVIDFGIAKATQQRLTDKTLFTAFEQFIGTPAYMSPEQTAMTSADIDTRTDIYSLGVLLYELLTGRTPFDTRALLQAGFDEVRRVIRETEPVKPSVRLTEELVGDPATNRIHGAQPGAPDEIRGGSRRLRIKELITELRGDLDWIVMKALEKDRTRRYETASGLASDVQRHMNNEPVIARPPSDLYRLKKLVRRNKLGVAAIVAIAAVLVLGTVVGTWQAIRATRARVGEIVQRKHAERNAEQARKYLYAADMNLAQQALEAGNLGRTIELLDRHRPAEKSDIGNPTSEMDLRGFEWRYLWQRCQGDEIATLRGHKETVSCVAFSPDGRLLASGSQDRTVRLWDTTSRRALRVLADYGDSIYSVGFSPDGQHLIAVGNDGVLVWNTDDWQVKERLAGKYDSIARKRGSKTFVVGRKGRVTVLDKTQGSYDLAHASGPVVLSLDEQLMATLGRDGIMLWSPSSLCATAVPLRILPLINSHFSYPLRTVPEPDAAFLHFSCYHELAFSPNGQIIGVGDNQGRVMLFDLPSGDPWPSFAQSFGRIDTMAFSPDGKTLAITSTDQTVKLWDLTGKTNLLVLRGHRGAVWSVAFSPDGQILATGSLDRTLKLWDLTPHNPVDEFQLGGQFSWISEDGTTAASWDIGDSVEFLNITKRQVIERIPMPIGTMCWSISADGGTLVLGTHLGRAQVWSRAEKTLGAPFLTKLDPLYRAQVSPDGRTLVQGTSMGGLRLWSLPDGRELSTFDDAGLPVKLLNDVVASTSTNYVLTLFNFKTGRRILGLKGHESDIADIAFSPDGQTIATASADETARLWDLTTGHEIGVLHGHSQGLSALDFSPDGRTLATGSADNTVKLWNVATRQEVVTLQPHLGDIKKVKFVPNGGALIAVCAGGRLKVWRAPSLGETDEANHQ